MAEATRRQAVVRLTPPMVELLDDLATHPQMYITRYSRWDRTAQALMARGLAVRTPGYHQQYEIKITDDGRKEHRRRQELARSGRG